MNFISISAIFNEKKNAAPKAPADIDYILSTIGKTKVIRILRKNENYKWKVYFNFLISRLRKGIIVIQYPLVLNAKSYDFLPMNRTVALIHDLPGLRKNEEKLNNNDINILKKFKYIIVHNEKMKNFLVSQGVKEKNLYILEIFDYIVQNNNDIIPNNNDLRIVYPGNLKKEKSPFIYQLVESKMNFRLFLYGLNVEKYSNNKIIYKGSFEPDNIESIIGDLGLIWDGNFDESDENLGFKNYTKFNNPHKISCCLACDMPIIVWRKSAVADFVIKNNIGYTISNLYDINDLDFSDYNTKKKNAEKIGKRIREGYYTKKVFKEIINNMKK